ncbi:hypothetical protein C0073_022780 (plasmid) [Aeromonas veronii]|nr:hypothetical protein C0073_022780 [Aeromonas veronii]
MSQAFTAEQWDRFKDWKLGDLRSPIETLQGIVQKHGAEGPWWESARKAADWCRTAKRPHPVEVHDALDGLIFRAQRDAEVNGAELPAWHQQATDARNVIEAAYTRKSRRHPAARALRMPMDACTSCTPRIARLCSKATLSRLPSSATRRHRLSAFSRAQGTRPVRSGGRPRSRGNGRIPSTVR